MNEIFKISPKDPERITSRESSTLEFKEGFGWKSLPKYLKTFAAFANTRGGYIIYGITNSPHKLAGLSGTSLQSFEELDSEKITNILNEHFAPEIHWEIQEHELNEKIFGLIYIFESRDKPVICKKSVDTYLKEGEIYYRYRGRSEKIKYPELRYIIEEKRKQEQKLWMKHFLKISRIGVKDVGIFDLTTGKVSGSGGSFIIDESLLSQLSFIKEGEFSEKRGKPTLRLIGDLEVVGDTSGLSSLVSDKRIVKTKGIRIGDIVGIFLRQTTTEEPIEYIKQICFESTGFLPVYYYMQLANINTLETIKMLESVISRGISKRKLIERLQSGKTQQLALPSTNSSSAVMKREYLNDLKNESVDESLSGKKLEYCLYAIRCLFKEDVQKHSKYLRELLRSWFNKYYSSAQCPLADQIRRAICWIDEALYM